MECFFIRAYCCLWTKIPCLSLGAAGWHVPTEHHQLKICSEFPSTVEGDCFSSCCWPNPSSQVNTGRLRVQLRVPERETESEQRQTDGAFHLFLHRKSQRRETIASRGAPPLAGQTPELSLLSTFVVFETWGSCSSSPGPGVFQKQFCLLWLWEERWVPSSVSAVSPYSVPCALTKAVLLSSQVRNLFPVRPFLWRRGKLRSFDGESHLCVNIMLLF